MREHRLEPDVVDERGSRSLESLRHPTETALQVETADTSSHSRSPRRDEDRAALDIDASDPWDTYGPVLIDDGLSRADVLAVSVGRRPARLRSSAVRRMTKSHATLMRWLNEGRHVYGASTGVGDLRKQRVEVGAWELLQTNIIRSHSCGIGPPLPVSMVRAGLALRTATFARGYSAVRPELAAFMVEMLNRGVHPIVPSCGSVGASGDPVLLAHLGLTMIGEGEAQVWDAPPQPASQALFGVGLRPLSLQPREGIGLVNGLDFTLASAVLFGREARTASRWADAIAGLSLDCAQGSAEPFESQVQAIRGPGAHRDVAARIRRLCAGSQLVRSHGGLQDPYCLRCIPQVHGATADALATVEDVIDQELDGVVDNPLIFSDDDAVYHCGHFHGQRLALAADHLALALVSLANISLARTSLLLRGKRELPSMLCRDPGSESGLMMLETTAGAIVGRMRAEASPLSVHSLSVSSEQEDHTSMAYEAWNRCFTLVVRLNDVLSAELLTAGTAATWRGLDKLGVGTRDLASLVAQTPVQSDRALAPDLARLKDLLRSTEPPGGASHD